MKRIDIALATLASLASFQSWSLGLDLGVGSNGVSGLNVFPMATVPHGSLLYQYKNQVIDSFRSEGYNQSLVVGLSSFSEIGLRIADTTVQSNIYGGGGGIRDLSASGKVQINPLVGLHHWPLKMAFGVIDYGGAATNFRSYFGVATVQGQNWVASAGYALAQNNPNNPLTGPFASTALQLTPWASVSAESNLHKSWVGLTLRNERLMSKLGAPKGASLSVGLNQQVRGANPTSAWAGLTLHLPLDWSLGRNSPARSAVPQPLPLGMPTGRLPEPVMPVAQVVPAAQVAQGPSLSPSHTDAAADHTTAARHAENLAMEDLAKRMAEHGFEGIDIGHVGDTLVVKFSDFTYEHSLLDGAGVALGLISTLKTHFIRYQLVQSRWGTPSVGYHGNLHCLAEWINDEGCDEERAVKPFFRNLAKATQGVSWRVKGHAPYQHKIRLRLIPVYSYYVATEYSMLDYSVGVNINPSIHLWDGGALEFSQVQHINSSKEFEKGGFYNYSRIKTANRRVLLHHMQRIDNGWSARVSAGQLMPGPLHGGQLELRWDSLHGEWASGINLSSWKAKPNRRGLPSGQPKTAFVRYAPTGTDWRMELIAGEYWFKDKGLTAISTHWFGDMQFSYFLRHSMPPQQFWPGKKSVTLAGFELNFPLTPRRAMQADRGFQIKGTHRFGVGLVTPIGRPDNYIVGSNGVPIYEKALVGTPIPAYAGSVLLDSDRANPSYFAGKLERLRYAHRRWGMSEQPK
jgi:hypothetical protein